MAAGSQITEQERAEASAVAARGSGHQFEIQLGHMCNNRCVFCSSGQLTALRLARPLPLHPMIRAIEDARADGARRITFLGGEPTLQRNFLGALQRAVELEFEEIVIFTNGVLLPQPGFVDRIVALGKFEWRISIQGANRDAHVAVTGKRDSFRRIVDGLKLLKERGQRVTANMCVNALSYKSLPEYPELVREYDIRQLHIDVVRPSSTGERDEAYLRGIMPRYSEMAPYMAEMLERFDRELPDFDVSLGNLPLCVLPKWAHRISHGGEETITKACDTEGLEVAVDKYRWHASLRQHVAACEGCAFRPDCTGIFSTYLELYGDDEFQTVTRDQLATLGVRDSQFVVFTDPLLDPMRTATPPAGWALRDWVRDRRERHVDARFVHSDGTLVSLRFDPPGLSTEAALVTPDYRMSLTAAPEIGEAELLRFITWIGETLGHAIETTQLLVTHRQRRLLAQGRARIRQLVERVESHGTFGGWAFAGRHEEENGSIVELRDGAGSSVYALFSIQLQAGKPRVSLDSRPGAGISAAAARATVQEVVRAIQDVQAG